MSSDSDRMTDPSPSRGHPSGYCYPPPKYPPPPSSFRYPPPNHPHSQPHPQEIPHLNRPEKTHFRPRYPNRNRNPLPTPSLENLAKCITDPLAKDMALKLLEKDKEKKKIVLRCDLCDVKVDNEQAFTMHLEGKAHKKKKAWYDHKDKLKCDVCQITDFSSIDVLNSHLSGKQKLLKIPDY